MGELNRAIISVFDKTGVAEFAKTLSNRGVEILSTGGTAKALTAAGVPVIDVSAYTGSPEILDGRVKTLHPKIHGGLLYIRGNVEHEKTIAEQGIKPIDLVVVDLYPEEIDIGGVTLIRAAAKNSEFVTVVVDPADYPAVLTELAEAGNTTPETRKRLAKKAFEKTAAYDAKIATRF